MLQHYGIGFWGKFQVERVKDMIQPKDCEHLHLERSISFQCLVVAVIQKNLVRRERSGGKVTEHK